MNASNSSALKGNLKSLVATGGVLAGASTASQAAIVYTDVAPDLTVSAGSTIYFSLTDQTAGTSAAAVDEQFRLYFTPSADRPNIGGGFLNSGEIAGYTSGFQFASKLSSGNIVNSGLDFYLYRYMALGGSGQWDPGNRAFLGLQFDSGGVKYGWADVEYTSGQQLKLYGFAYDDSGGSINAGQIAPVPEPAVTGAIAAVLAGSVAAFEARRRRKAARQVPPEPVATV